jgi:hypothetical protein
MSEEIEYKSFEVRENKSWYKIRFLINDKYHYLDLNQPNFTTKINKKVFKKSVHEKLCFNYQCDVDDESNITGYIAVNIKDNILNLTTLCNNQKITS